MTRCPECGASYATEDDSCSARFERLLALDHSRQEPWGSRHGQAFAAFALMSALLFDQGILATAIVAAGVVPAMMTLRALETAGTRSPSWRVELVPVLLALLVSVPLALFAFLFIPRLSSPLWGAPTMDRATTGLSDRMAPGDMAEVLTDDTPAMRVTFDGPTPIASSRYFRAFTMTRFDGQAWSPGFGGRDTGTLEGQPRFHYRVTLEPTRERVLPLLDMPLDAPTDATLRGDRTAVANQRLPVRERRRCWTFTARILAPINS